MDYDEHQRCRELSERQQNYILSLKDENERLLETVRSYEAAETLMVKRTCHVPTKSTNGKTVLMSGDRIVVMRKSGKE